MEKLQAPKAPDTMDKLEPPAKLDKSEKQES